MQGLVVALDINGTIVDGDSIDPELVGSTSLTEPACKLITDITKRISISKQNIQVVVFTMGVDWPGVLKQIEDISGGVISFNRGTGLMYVGRAAEADPPAVFLRQLVEDESDKQPFEHDGIMYDGPDPTWLDPGPALSYETFRERTEAGKHLILRGVYKSGNGAVVGREDNTLAAKLVVSKLPVIVFDDHPGDWEVISPKQRIVKAVSPENASGEKTATDFCKELIQFEVSL